QFDVPIATQLLIYTRGLIQQVKDRITRHPHIPARFIDVASHEYRDGLNALQVCVNIHIVRIDTAHSTFHNGIQLAMADSLDLNGADRRNEYVALCVYREHSIHLDSAPKAKRYLVARQNAVVWIEPV